MPFGGVANFQGLQLQTSTPGFSQTGNFHIGGTGIADTNFSSRGNISGLTAASSQIVGENFTVTGTSINQVTVLGFSVQLGSFAGTIAQSVAIGAAASINGNVGNIAIGNSASAGPSGDVGADSGAIAIGQSAQAATAVASGKTGPIAIGYQARNTGATISHGGICIGNLVQATNRNNVTAVGANAAINASNVIYMGSNSSGATVTISTANLIQIGDSTQTSVQIGPYTLGNTKRTAVNDTNYTVLGTDSLVGYTAISAARVVTLPAANSVGAGKQYTVADESGNASAVNTITINRAGADTINGAASTVITTAFGSRTFYSDGVSKWTIIGSL